MHTAHTAVFLFFPKLDEQRDLSHHTLGMLKVKGVRGEHREGTANVNRRRYSSNTLTAYTANFDLAQKNGEKRGRTSSPALLSPPQASVWLFVVSH